MAVKNNQFLDANWRAVRCYCENGHSFSTRLHNRINLAQDPELAKQLVRSGIAEVRCSICRDSVALAEAITIHHPDQERLALWVPVSLSHRVLELRAELLGLLAKQDPRDLAQYVTQFDTLIGRDELDRWLQGPAQEIVEPVAERPTSAPPAPAKGQKHEEQAKAAEQPGTEGHDPGQAIHAAFADLADPGQEPDSGRPDSSAVDDESAEETYSDDDWLGNGLDTTRTTKSGSPTEEPDPGTDEKDPTRGNGQ